MANANDDAAAGSHTTSQETPKISSRGSASVIAPKTPSIGGRRTEVPVQPEHLKSVFNVKDAEEATIGNPEMCFSLKVDGQLGIFYNRSNVTRLPTPIEVYPTVFRECVLITLTDVCDRLLTNREHLTFPEATMDAATLSSILSQGIVVALYLKLRSVNYLDHRFENRFYKRPKVPEPFEVPQPYALAISQLGQIKVSGLVNEVYLTPVIPADAGTNFCLPTGVQWSAANYGRAVDYAKKIGLQFSTVDLNVKMGSTWWLMRPVTIHPVFQLCCPFPEENFTKQTAVLRTLFCINAGHGFHTDLIDFNPIGADDYGVMLRNPPHRIDLSTYFAIEGTLEVVWKVV